MEFLGMIGIGMLGLFACFRVFGLLIKLMGRGFDKLENVTLGEKKNSNSRRQRWFDDDDDDD